MESLLHNSLEKQSGKGGITKTGSGIKTRRGNVLLAYLPLPIFFYSCITGDDLNCDVQKSEMCFYSQIKYVGQTPIK